MVQYCFKFCPIFVAYLIYNKNGKSCLERKKGSKIAKTRQKLVKTKFRNVATLFMNVIQIWFVTPRGIFLMNYKVRCKIHQ